VNALGGYWTWIAAALAALTAVGVAVRRYRSAPQRRVDNPKSLFRDLCWAHDLTRREISLLRSLADHWRLTTPSLLFIQPSHFDTAKLGPSWEPYATRIVDLRDRLFLSELDEAVTRT
jgi:hypothetical protein